MERNVTDIFFGEIKREDSPERFSSIEEDVIFTIYFTEGGQRRYLACTNREALHKEFERYKEDHPSMKNFKPNVL